MTQATFGEFEDGKVYLDSVVAKKWGKSLSLTRQLLTDNFDCADLGNGVLAISGLYLRLGIERMAQAPKAAADADGHSPRSITRRRAKSAAVEG